MKRGLKRAIDSFAEAVCLASTAPDPKQKKAVRAISRMN